MLLESHTARNVNGGFYGADDLRERFYWASSTSETTPADDMRTQRFHHHHHVWVSNTELTLVDYLCEGGWDSQMCKTDIHRPEIVQKRYNLSLPARTEYTNDSNQILYRTYLWHKK